MTVKRMSVQEGRLRRSVRRHSTPHAADRRTTSAGTSPLHRRKTTFKGLIKDEAAGTTKAYVDSSAVGVLPPRKRMRCKQPDPMMSPCGNSDMCMGVSPDQLALTLLVNAFANSLPTPVEPQTLSCRRKAQDESNGCEVCSSTSASSSSSSSADAEPRLDKGESSIPKGLRAQIFTKIEEALMARVSCGSEEHPAARPSPSRREAKAIAAEIANEFSAQWATLDRPRLHLRGLLRNIRDTKNPDFVRKVLAREIPLRSLPKMNSEEMASSAKQSERMELRLKYAKESTLQRSLSGVVDQRSLLAYKVLASRR